MTAATVIQKTVPVEICVIGNVEAYSTISVKSQIEGQLIRVNFREGQDVKKGDLLFTIDPRPYEAALKQAVNLQTLADQLLLQAYSPAAVRARKPSSTKASRSARPLT